MIYKPKRDPAIETTTLPDGHAVIVMPETEWAHTLSPLGAIVWEFCDGKSTIDEIVEQVLSVPGVPARPELGQEIKAMIVKMEEDGVISSSEELAENW